jgi:hypothetical protein
LALYVTIIDTRISCWKSQKMDSHQSSHVSCPEPKPPVELGPAEVGPPGDAWLAISTMQFSSRDFVRLQRASGLCDGYPLEVTAIIRVDNELLQCGTSGELRCRLQGELLVRPVDVDLHLVLTPDSHCGQLGKAVLVSNSQNQRLLGPVNNRCRKLGTRHCAELTSC